jgi:hypothetical protein
MTVLVNGAEKGAVSALVVTALVAALCGCAEDPWVRVQKARAQFEVEISGSVPDAEGGSLLIEALLKKEGREPLDALTLRVEQRNAKGGVLSVDHVTVDVSGIRKWSNRQITLRVPLAGEAAHGLTVSVEMEPKPGVTYPEFEGLTPPE